MKVLQINSVCGIGSTGKIAADISARLQDQHIESYIAYGRETSIQSDSLIRIGTKLDYYIHGGLTRILDRHALWGSGKATRDFIEKVRMINPDVVHLHNIHGYYINMRVLFDYLRESNKPVIWTLHDCWSFTGHCAYFSNVQCDKWKVECQQCPQKGSYPGSLVLDQSKQNYLIKKQIFTSLDKLTLVVPSNWLADLVGQSFMSRVPLEVIYNGIDINVFQPADGENIRTKYGLGNRFVILGVANIWETRKGLRYFLQLSKMISDDCIIMLIGLNEAQIAKLPPNIIGISRTTDIHELVQMYSMADVFVNPSNEETFGLVTAEAMACGTPAIVFSATPGEEIVLDGCGLVAKSGITADIKDCIDKIKNNGKNHYSKQCISTVGRYFTRDSQIDKYIDIYKDVNN